MWIWHVLAPAYYPRLHPRSHLHPYTHLGQLPHGTEVLLDGVQLFIQIDVILNEIHARLYGTFQSVHAIARAQVLRATNISCGWDTTGRGQVVKGPSLCGMEEASGWLTVGNSFF